MIFVSVGRQLKYYLVADARAPESAIDQQLFYKPALAKKAITRWFSSYIVPVFG
jgi:hypothetical protein